MAGHKNDSRQGHWAPGVGEPAMPDPRAIPNPPPLVGDYIVEPETDNEFFEGEVRKCLPANATHSRQHAKLIVLLSAYCAPGYVVDVDLLTRQSEDNNFASDSCIRKDGFDPNTGDRHLEELAFEIKATQRPGDLRKRARIMAERGVRRIFAIPVKGDSAGHRIIAGPLQEWLHESDNWHIYRGDEMLEDACLRQPLKASALLDAIEADRALGEALIASGNAAIVEHAEARYRDGKDAGYRDGKDDGRREGIHLGLRSAVLTLLHARDIELHADAKRHIESCQDETKLRRWLERAAQARTLRDIVDNEF